MKLQQQHTDTSILGENFEAQTRVPWWKKVWNQPSKTDVSRMEKALYGGVIWLIVATTAYVFVMIGYNPAFRQIAGVHNPFSAVQEIAQTRSDMAQLETAYLEGMGRVDSGMEQLAELRTTQATANNPQLLAVKSLRENRPAWDKVLMDIDGAIKKTVESNDILQRIVLGDISFSADTSQGTLSKVKVYANGDQSSLSLAARFVQALEASPSIKDVANPAPVTQQETASGAILTYTPLDITFSVQRDQEVTGNDTDRTVRDVRDEIESLQKPQ